MKMLVEQNHRGELTRQVREMGLEDFKQMLARVTAEAEEFLRVIDMSNDRGFESMLEQVLEAFTLKIGQILRAERSSLWLLDEKRGELWSKVFGGERRIARVPMHAGIVGRVVDTGESMNVPDAYAEPLFNRAVDQETGFRTRNLLAVPLRDSEERVFGVAQILNKGVDETFDAEDEKRFREFTESMEVLLESWWHMAQADSREPRSASPAATP
jgi:adenylate cyclase